MWWQWLFLPRHSREGGNSETYLLAQRAACFDLPPFGQERTRWIPAFAGMTVKCIHLIRKRSKTDTLSISPCRATAQSSRRISNAK
jgi:hypothetical protein